MEMEKKCLNCGKFLEDSLLTHCSEKCYYENYLKSQSSETNTMETELDSV